MFKRALVFQHMDNEPPGLYGEFLRSAGARVKAKAMPQMAAIRHISQTLFDNLLSGIAIRQAA